MGSLISGIARKGIFLSTSCLSAICIASPALAQDAGGQNEIIVTAQKREQNLQDVGVSISALDGAQIEAMGIDSAKDIAKAVPGLLLDSGSGGGFNALLTIRGISQSDFSSNQESPNSIYIDEVYISSSNAAAFPVYDLQRIEALRGPQGTLFGRASSGGLVQFITRRPTDYFEGYAEVGYGSFDHVYAEGAMGGPIAENLRFRIAGRAEQADGWFENRMAGGKDSFETANWGIRGQLEADLSPTITARLAVSYDKSPKHREGIYKHVASYIDADGQPAELPADVDAYGTGAGNDMQGYRDPYEDGQTGAFNDYGYLSNSRFSPTLYVDVDLGAATLSSISNYTRFKFDYLEDCDGSPIDACRQYYGQKLDQFSQELRLTGTTGGLTYTTGAYFLDITQDNRTAYDSPLYAGTDYGYGNINTVHQELRSFALFGQLEYELTDTVKLTAGARWTHDNKKFSSQVYYTELGNGYSGGTGTNVYDPPLLDYDFRAGTVGELAERTDDLFSGKLQIDWKPGPDTLFYASASRGVKGGGFNANLAGTVTNDDTPFKDEYLYAYEIGSKLELFDRMLRLNSSVFYYDYHDYQGYALVGIGALVSNYDGYFTGGELEAMLRPGGGITLTGGVAYLESKIRDVNTAYSGTRDQESIQAPRWTLNGQASKEFNLGDAVSMTLQWDASYVSRRYASIDNNAATLIRGSFVHNARVTFDLHDADIELAAFVSNISDVDRENFIYDLTATGGYLVRSYAKPRTWGVSARKSF